MEQLRNCKIHGLTKYQWQVKTPTRGFWRCLECRKLFTRNFVIKRKKLLVYEAGGKCARCDYNRNMAALHFHHLKPSEKSFGIAAKSTASIEKSRKEIAKCVLLCANCHAEVESGEPLDLQGLTKAPALSH